MKYILYMKHRRGHFRKASTRLKLLQCLWCEGVRVNVNNYLLLHVVYSGSTYEQWVLYQPVIRQCRIAARICCIALFGGLDRGVDWGTRAIIKLWIRVHSMMFLHGMTFPPKFNLWTAAKPIASPEQCDHWLNGVVALTISVTHVTHQ